jgi:hypothetical protein
MVVSPSFWPARLRKPRCADGTLGWRMSALRHVWTAPPWQELSELLQHWSGAVMCPACLCGGEAAGHNALRGSGPNRKHAFKDAMTQTGSPDPRIDLVCITSSCPRQFLQNFKRRRRCLASPPCRSRFTQPVYSTSMPQSARRPQHHKRTSVRLSHVRFTPEIEQS